MEPLKSDRIEIPISDAAYPACLLDLPDPPRLLYAMGSTESLRQGLGVIGARKATPYGLECSRRFAGWAASADVTIVSGAAIGCDRAAGEAASACGGSSIAVLGCGADIDYPAASGRLLRELRTNGGIVLSELKWGTPPSRWTFVRRNRIIAAFSAALLVVEAGLPSGTFSTADFALDLGRDVLAIPGSINHPESRGANRLIRQGATPVTDVSELAEALAQAGLHCSTSATAWEQPERRDPLERALLADPMRPDDLARALDLDVVSVARHLGELEMAGVVLRFRDGRYGINTSAQPTA